MIDYALARDRKIGMIQTDEKNELFNVGCVGKINSFNETNDGRYLISLHGIKCFKIINEIEQDYSFRLINASLVELYEKEGEISKDQKESLLKLYGKYIKNKNINLSLEEIDNIETDQIIKFIAMVSPFKNIDKQALLETESLLDFYSKLKSIIELELIGDFENKTIN